MIRIEKEIGTDAPGIWKFIVRSTSHDKETLRSVADDIYEDWFLGSPENEGGKHEIFLDVNGSEVDVSRVRDRIQHAIDAFLLREEIEGIVRDQTHDLIEAMKISNLKSERKWDDMLVGDLSDIVIPFGKYTGKTLGDVPLKYLDEVVSVMPQTWLIRRVIEFVDHAMSHPMASGFSTGRADKETFNSLEKQWEDQRKLSVVREF